MLYSIGYLCFWNGTCMFSHFMFFEYKFSTPKPNVFNYVFYLYRETLYNLYNIKWVGFMAFARYTMHIYCIYLRFKDLKSMYQRWGKNVRLSLHQPYFHI